MQKDGARFEQHKTKQGAENNSVGRTPRAKQLRRESTDDRILCSIDSSNNSNNKTQQLNFVGCNNFSICNAEKKKRKKSSQARSKRRARSEQRAKRGAKHTKKGGNAEMKKRII